MCNFILMREIPPKYLNVLSLIPRQFSIILHVFRMKNKLKWNDMGKAFLVKNNYILKNGYYYFSPT